MLQESEQENATTEELAGDGPATASSIGVEVRYSIQLISFRKKASVARFARDEGLIGKALQLESMDSSSAPWYALFIGAFADRAAATAALEGLPASLRRLGPIIRPLASSESLVPVSGAIAGERRTR